MTLSIKTALFCIGNILLFLGLIKLFFKTRKKFLAAVYYLFIPDIISDLKKDFEEDFKATHLFWLMILLFFGLVAIQLFLFF